MKHFTYENLKDAKKHEAAIERLAASFQVRVEDVQLLYEKTLTEMLEQARVMTFLPIFTARRVEKLLIRIRKTNPGIGDGDLTGISTA
jgi:hypothetical protein